MKLKLSNYAKLNNISYMTAYRLVKNNSISYEKLPTGTIIVTIDDVKNKDTIKVVLYARVSSSENKDNLDSQLERLRLYATAKGYNIIKEIKEVGSGLNDNRPQLEKVFMSSDWDIIIVEHKDRLARFGTNYIIKLLDKLNKKVEIINEVLNDKDDLMQDFVSIITSFTARLYGLRRSKRKTESIIKELSENE